MGFRARLDHGWLLILLAIFLITLTCLHTQRITKNITFLNKSQSYSLFILRTLSELAGLSLAAAISAAFEQIKWSLVCRDGQVTGIGMGEFLGLQESTSVLGLMSLAAAPGVRSFRARLWSLARLVSMVIVPLAGVIIMSDVNTEIVFSSEQSQAPYQGFGMNPINASIGLEYRGFTDLVLSSRYYEFLADPFKSIDLTPQSQNGKSCNFNANSQNKTNCHQTYFVPGELSVVAPELRMNSSYPDANVFITENHRGYLLDFNAGDSDLQFNKATDCRIYSSRSSGYEAGAIFLCVSNSSPSELQARLVTCPGTVAAKQMCLNDTSWHNNVDWSIKMQTSFRDASVAYSRSNASILWHSFSNSPAIPVNISASQILQAYDGLLMDTSTLTSSNGTKSLISGSAFPAFVWLTEPVFSVNNAANPSLSMGAISVLQSLLAIPLYYCQNGIAKRLLLPSSDSESSSNPLITELSAVLSPLPERTTSVQFAHLQYELIVTGWPFISYVALSGAAVIFCCIAQLTSCFMSRADTDAPEMTFFPALDVLTYCAIENEYRQAIYKGNPRLLQDVQGNTLMKKISTLRVKKAGPNLKEGLHLNKVQVKPKKKVDKKADKFIQRPYESPNMSLAALYSTLR